MAAYLATHRNAGGPVAKLAIVHGFSVAYWWAFGFLAASALISLLAVNAGDPRHSPETIPAGEGSSNPAPARVARLE